MPLETEAPHFKREFLRGEGGSLAEALSILGAQLVQHLGSAHKELEAKKVEMTCHGQDPKSLLLSWLEMLIYRMESGQAAVVDLQLEVEDGKHLRARGYAAGLLSEAPCWPRAVDPHSAMVFRDLHGLWRVCCSVDFEQPKAFGQIH